MLTIQLTNSRAYPATNKVVEKIDATAGKVGGVTTAPLEFCYCPFECEYTELALADVGGDAYRNDKSSFIFAKTVASDSITFQLYKAGVLIATLNDNTLGEYYSTFTAQPLYTGFVIDWELVYSTHGPGLYQFKAQQTILGDATTFESRKFRLLNYSDVLANGTVRIESYQNGSIIGSSFDFTGLNWYSSYRISGKFSQKTPLLEIDNYVTAEFQKTQVQDRIKTEYTLQTKLLPSVVANAINYDSLLANAIYITDYNIFNFEVYRQVALRPIGIDAKEHEQSRSMSFAVKFEAVADYRKRNF